ncbi:uncharacterized protein TNCV_114951 [Trichonephila clavipes]|nr:uncharacterized protein TNCV_114951 [Trichonephila clavipes]
MVLKATANDRRHIAHCHDEFRGSLFGLCRSGVISNNNNRGSGFALKTTSLTFFEKGNADLEGEKDFNDDNKEEFTDFVQSIPGFQECDEENVGTGMASDAEDCGFQKLNDDEIVTPMQEDCDHVNDETDEDEDNYNNESSKVPSNADAFSALEIAMEWCEQQSECCPTRLLLLKRIRDLAA